MNGPRFDELAKVFANRRLSRRQAVTSATAAIATGALGAAGTTAAQEATPASGGDDHKPEFLFVQAFQSGSIAPSETTEGRYTAILEHGLGQTIYFSDRPDRIVGTTPTGQFLDGLGFPRDNPPNAAIITDNGDGESTLAVVELFAPAYDADTATVSYELAVLEQWEDTVGMGFTETPVDLGAIGASFGTAHLFIDGCPDMNMICFNLDGDRQTVGVILSTEYGGLCLSADGLACVPCHPTLDTFEDAQVYWDGQCTARYEAECGSGGCGHTYY